MEATGVCIPDLADHFVEGVKIHVKGRIDIFVYNASPKVVWFRASDNRGHLPFDQKWAKVF